MKTRNLFSSTLILGALLVLTGVSARAQTLSVTNGLVLWLKADAGVETNISGVITQWLDMTTNGNHAIATAGPTLVPNAMNGLPLARFNGTSINLQVASSPSVALTGDLALYAVANFADAAANRAILGKNLGNRPAS